MKLPKRIRRRSPVCLPLLSGTICIVIVAIFYRNLPGLRAAAAPALAKQELSFGEPGIYPVSED
jgi:hypothetical protein